MNWYWNVLKKYAVFNGRAQRAEYWYFILFNMIIGFMLSFLDSTIGTKNLFYETYLLATIIPYIAVSARRLHDTGKSGWWILITLIPLIGGIIFFIWSITDSEKDNKYGPNPKRNKIKL